jgi:hypothetical protein
MRTRIAAVIGAAALVACGAWGPTATFGATAADGTACTAVVHRDLSDVKIDTDGTTTDATTSLLAAGVQVTTPDDAANMYVRFPTVFALADVTRMAYATYRYATSTDILPAYEIDVLLSGHANTATDPLPDGWTGPWLTTLVYEPDRTHGKAANAVGTWQTWDAYQGGTAKWRSTSELAAIRNGSGKPATWASILAAYPNAVGTGYDVHQGTGDAGAITAFNDVTFAASAGCTTQSWTDTEPAANPSPPAGDATSPGDGYADPSPSASRGVPGTGDPARTPGGASDPLPSPSPSPRVTRMTNASTSTTSGGLALTGPDFMVPAGFGLMLMISGVVLFRVARRRREIPY